MKPALLRALLIALLVAVQLVTMTAVLYGMRDSAAERFVLNSGDSLGRLADLVTVEIGGFLVPAKTAIELTTRMVADGTVDASDSRAMLRYMLGQLKANATFETLNFSYPDGRFIGARREAGAFSATINAAPGSSQMSRKFIYSPNLELLDAADRPEKSIADPRQRPWYLDARTKPGLNWTDPYILSPLGRPGITAASALRDSTGQDVGVLGIDIETRALSDYVARIPAVQQGTAAMVDRDGSLIAMSARAQPGTLSERTRLPRLEEVAGLPLQTLLDTHKKNANARSTEVAELSVETGAERLPPIQEHNFVRFSSEGYERIGLVLPVSVFGDRPSWQLLAQTPVTGMTTQLTALFEEKVPMLGLLIVLPGLLSVIGVLTLTAPLYKLHEQATVDKLTSALNRSAFERRLQGMTRARRGVEAGLSIALIAFDMDGFKQINDTYGHIAGDAVLCEFVKRLRGQLRRDDLIGRLGGDEFVVAAWVDKQADPCGAIERVRSGAVTIPYPTPGSALWLGVTAGMTWVEPGEPVAVAMARADRALVAGKTLCKNQLYTIDENDAVRPAIVVEPDQPVEPTEAKVQLI